MRIYQYDWWYCCLTHRRKILNVKTSSPELKALLGATVETLINQLVSLDEHSTQGLLEIEGKLITLEITDLEIEITFHIQTPRILLMTEYTPQADTLIITNSKTITEMGLHQVMGNSASLHGKLEITGDIETGQKFKSILDSLNIDWEEHLSHVTGDVIAHQLFRSLDKFTQWSKASWEHFSQDSSAWLTDEKQLLPHKNEIEYFSKQVNKVRNDVERIAARIQQYERQHTH